MVLCCIFVVVVNPFRNTNIVLSSGPYRSSPQAKSSPPTHVLTTPTDVWTPGPLCASVTSTPHKVGMALACNSVMGLKKGAWVQSHLTVLSLTVYFILTIFIVWQNKTALIFHTLVLYIQRFSFCFLARVEEMFLIYHNGKCKKSCKL